MVLCFLIIKFLFYFFPQTLYSNQRLEASIVLMSTVDRANRAKILPSIFENESEDTAKNTTNGKTTLIDGKPSYFYKSSRTSTKTRKSEPLSQTLHFKCDSYSMYFISTYYLLWLELELGF